MRIILGVILFLFISTTTMQAQLSSDKLIKQGIALHDQKKYMEAISCYQQALKVNPSSISAVYEMSLSYLKMKDYDNAIIRSTQVINMDFKPILVDAYVVKGTALAAQDKLKEAIELFKQAIETCGDEYLLHYNLGLSYYNMKDMEQAAVHLRKALEIDNTHSETYLLYAYALNDINRWVESFYSFHFFLLLEPNTQRSVEVFLELYNLLDQKLSDDDKRLTEGEGIDRKALYNEIQKNKTKNTDLASRYKFFEDATKTVFSELSKKKNTDTRSFLWTFFVPIYAEILDSGHFHTYCRYISASCFPESHTWWETNKEAVDNFIDWFEYGEYANGEDNEHSEVEE